MNTRPQTPKAPARPWNFNTSPAARLAHYKALADFYADTYPQASNNAARNWRDKQKWNKPAILKTSRQSCTYNKEKQLYFVDDIENCPFIYLGDASDHARLDHTGWHADNYYQELIKPAVVAFRDPRQLIGECEDPNGWTRLTHLQYLPATYRTESDGATIDASCYYETARDAARAADDMAEREAEDSREYCAKDAAELEIEEKRTEIHEINREFLALSAEAKKAKANPYPGHVCAAVREKLADLLANRREAFERIEELKDDFWAAVPNF